MAGRSVHAGSLGSEWQPALPGMLLTAGLPGQEAAGLCPEGKSQDVPARSGAAPVGFEGASCGQVSVEEGDSRVGRVTAAPPPVQSGEEGTGLDGADPPRCLRRRKARDPRLRPPPSREGPGEEQVDSCPPPAPLCVPWPPQEPSSRARAGTTEDTPCRGRRTCPCEAQSAPSSARTSLRTAQSVLVTGHYPGPVRGKRKGRLTEAVAGQAVYAAAGGLRSRLGPAGAGRLPRCTRAAGRAFPHFCSVAG